MEAGILTATNYHQICDRLALRDADLQAIITRYGYPPLWSRPNTFESLVHIILEQQVSLASALAALHKLRERLPLLTPETLLLLSDEELKACYFSRQKASYTRLLAQALVDGDIDLLQFEGMTDEDVRLQLTALKGIGNWTVDIYLMFVLQRCDIFPSGDLAAVNALKKIKGLPTATSRADVLLVAEKWKPYRSAACMILWHYYLSAGKTQDSL